MNSLIFDTDPGIDDAIALLVAKQLDLDVSLIVSTYGNVSHQHTDRNARDLANILNFDCPVLCGADKPISGSPFTAEYVHGDNGFGDIQLNIESKPSIVVDDYIDYYYQAIVKNSPVDIITLGPLTNLAGVISKYSNIAKYISSVTVMGYGFEVYNVNDISEFNVICDPFAADIIAKANLPITIVPLDVTHRVQLSQEEVNHIKKYISKDECGIVFGQILQYLYDTSVKQGDEGAIIHDATAVIAYFYPELFEFKSFKIDVLESGAVDYFENNAGVRVAMNVNRERYIDTMMKLFIKT